MRISLGGQVRATGVKTRWLQYYVNEKYDNVPRVVVVSKNRSGRLTIDKMNFGPLPPKRAILSGYGKRVTGTHEKLLAALKAIVVVFVPKNYGIHYLVRSKMCG